MRGAAIRGSQVEDLFAAPATGPPRRPGRPSDWAAPVRGAGKADFA
jgi:hypothetical protein